MTDDLVTRLKEEAEGAEFSSKYADLVAEAAARIEADAATIARAHQAWLDADKLATERLRQLVDAEAKVAALVEALEAMRGNAISLRGDQAYREFSRYVEKATRAAIAAAKGGRDIKQSRIDTLHEALDAEEAKVAALVEALEGMRGAVCGETGFAECVRRYSGNAYPWPALDAADEAARAAIAAAKGGA